MVEGRRRRRVLGNPKHAEEGHGGSSTKAESIMRAAVRVNVAEEDVQHGKRDRQTTRTDAGRPLEPANSTEEIMDAAKPGRRKTENGVTKVEGGHVDLNGAIGKTMSNRGNVEFKGDSGERKRSEAVLTTKPGITVPS